MKQMLQLLDISVKVNQTLVNADLQSNKIRDYSKLKGKISTKTALTSMTYTSGYAEFYMYGLVSLSSFFVIV